MLKNVHHLKRDCTSRDRGALVQTVPWSPFGGGPNPDMNSARIQPPRPSFKCTLLREFLHGYEPFKVQIQAIDMHATQFIPYHPTTEKAGASLL